MFRIPAQSKLPDTYSLDVFSCRVPPCGNTLLLSIWSQIENDNPRFICWPQWLSDQISSQLQTSLNFSTKAYVSGGGWEGEVQCFNFSVAFCLFFWSLLKIDGLCLFFSSSCVPPICFPPPCCCLLPGFKCLPLLLLPPCPSWLHRYLWLALWPGCRRAVSDEATHTL